MSHASDANQPSRISAHDVVDYLLENPSFFNHHSEVLLDLEIPHVNGGTVSLFDRQLTTLREENRRLKLTLNDLIQNARSNEALIKKIHELALLLMEATGPQAIFATLDEQLCAHFQSDRSRVLIFAEGGFVEAETMSQFIGANAGPRAPFEAVLAAKAPWCGQLTEQYRDALWPEQSLAGSIALLPLEGSHWQGILAVHSDDAKRFETEMGTDLLTYISDIVALIVEPWVARSSE